MDIICAPAGIVDSICPQRGIVEIADAGFGHILLDISQYYKPAEFEKTGKETRADEYGNRIKLSEYPEKMSEVLHPMIHTCKSCGLTALVAYAPYLMRDTQRNDMQEIMTRMAEESIKAASHAGCRYIVIRPLFAGISKKDLWEANRGYYLKLAETAKVNDMMILLENQCKDIGGHLVRGVCSDALDAARWIDRLNTQVGEERFGFCMDVGGCSICGQNMYDFIMALGDRLKVVILRENDGCHDNALLPFTCAIQGRSQTDWLNLIRGLREIFFDGQLIMDIRDTATAFSPVLHSGLLKMAKSVADYFRWQIEMECVLKSYTARVLFGAGNMCRNFMKCYGEKYPPLYTCDNNKKRWGERFCGLLVREPTCLQKLEQNCAIVICNIYYREIEKQLKEMNIRNPIVYFNDEYMPSFYYDRLKRDWLLEDNNGDWRTE